MRDCETLNEDLKAFLDGELSLVARTVVRLHLIRCAACREEVEKMKQITNELMATEAQEQSSALRARLLAGIPERIEGGVQEGRPRISMRRGPLLAWGAAAVVALAWFTYSAVPSLRQSYLQGERSMGRSDSYHEFSPMMALKSSGGHSGPAYAAAAEAKSDGAADSAGPQTYASTPKKDEPISNLYTPDVNSSTTTARPKESNPRGDLKEAQAGPLAAGYAPQLGGRERAALMKAAQAHDLGGRPVRAEASELREGATPDAGLRQVHKEASLTVEVPIGKLEETSDTVERLVKETAGGFVASSQLATDEDGGRSASLTAKVPVGEFENVLAKVVRLGTVKAKSVTGEDLTERISDQAHAKRSLVDQINDAREALGRMRSRSDRRYQMETIRDLRVSLAESQGRLELLNKLAALGTMTIELREKPKSAEIKSGGLLGDMEEAAAAALQSLKEAARVPVMIMIWFVAYAPVWIALVFAYRYVVKATARRA